MRKVRRENPAQGILWTEVRLEGKVEKGTGHFVVQLVPTVLGSRALVATTSHIEHLNVAIGIHSQTRMLVALVGDSLRATAENRKSYHLPLPDGDGRDRLELQLDFANWQILRAQLDGTDLQAV